MLSFSVDKILAKDGPSSNQKYHQHQRSTLDMSEKGEEELESCPSFPSKEEPSDTNSEPSSPDLHPKAKKKTDKRGSNCSPGFIIKDGIKVELLGHDLWRKFHKLGTEMIITKAGRRMFPTLKVRLSGLDPSKSYSVHLELVPYDDKRYRYVYHSSQWMIAGAGDPHTQPTTFVHGDSPASGRIWMSQSAITFDKLKLTNNRAGAVPNAQVCLHSMHKYLPRILIKSTEDEQCISFNFPETVFTTVTAYQNQQITKLKIASNPFAKGFREATRTRDPSVPDYPSGSSLFKHVDDLAHPFLPNPILLQPLLAAAAASSHFVPHPHPHQPGPGFHHPWSFLPAFLPFNPNMVGRALPVTPGHSTSEDLAEEEKSVS